MSAKNDATNNVTNDPFGNEWRLAARHENERRTIATNYQIDTYKKKIYIYGIAITSDEKQEVIKEAKEILDVENVVASIILVDDLRIQKD